MLPPTSFAPNPSLIWQERSEWNSMVKKREGGDFPVGPMAKIPSSQCKGPALIPGQGTRSHITQPNIPHAATKTQCSQINKHFFFFLKERDGYTCSLGYYTSHPPPPATSSKKSPRKYSLSPALTFFHLFICSFPWELQGCG